MTSCKVCGIEKLSNEFLQVPLSEECNHPPLACLRCVVDSCEKKKQCPHPSCSSSISPDSEMIQWCKAILEEMFKEYEADYTPQAIEDESANEILNVTVLNGDAIQMDYTSSMTMSNVMEQIETRLKIPPKNQKLLYDDKQLQIFSANGNPLTLSENGIPPYATLYLVVLLLEIPDSYDHVVFDLHWGYPAFGCDYLDASCLGYQDLQFVKLADFRRSTLKGVTHSGDVMDDCNRIGHHTIDVHLKQVPSNVTHLFFTLSAWQSPNISRFPNPSLKFYEASDMKKDLCKTTFTEAGNSQAIVMCSLSKNKQGRWEIYENGKLSAGNAMDYSPIKSTISNLIRSGY